MPDNKIEILSVSLLDQHRPLVEVLKQRARLLRIELGWHYLLDLTWILALLRPVTGKRIMDAGAGVGLLQWMLAGQGAQVLSVDRSSRADLPVRFRARFHVTGMHPQDLSSSRHAWWTSIARAPGWRGKLAASLQETADLLLYLVPRQSKGGVQIYNHDLQNLSKIPDASLDAVVAVSALEHNQPEALKRVVSELMRLLKPGGILLATLAAARDGDWFHEPSRGWCYTETSLRRAFRLPAKAPSNYGKFDSLMSALRNCAELRDNLAGFYFRSADNGMPWGKWDPRYQPVGVCKVKS